MCRRSPPRRRPAAIWQVLHYYVESERIAELPEVAPQLIFMALAPFLGEKKAARVARRPSAMPAR